VALRYVLDLPEAEIAALMGVTRGAVSATLTTARRTLADRLTTGVPSLEEIPHA
jgi:DNA-directed RNA polymerase specialized sigma24 family protein